MCLRCTSVAITLLSNRLARRPDQPSPELDKRAGAIDLMELIFAECADTQDATMTNPDDERVSASAKRVVDKLTESSVESVHQLHSLLRDQADFLKATASMLNDHLLVRAAKGDAEAQAAFGWDGEESMKMQVHIIDLDALRAAQKKPNQPSPPVD